jgi:hypothetical protein
MQEKQLFEYAIIRVMPRVERGEFINVGVILYCSGKKFLRTLCKVDKQRLQLLSPELNLEEIEERLRAFKEVCLASKEGGPIAKLPIASRFRWLTAARSTVVQTSPVHPGLCADPNEMIERLFEQLVG